MESKKFWLSKTFWMNVIVPVAACFIPGIDQFIAANPAEVAFVWGLINVGLRFITKGKITIS